MNLSHVHLDLLGGIAGDMFVAAMLAACPDLKERVLADCAAVLPEGLSATLSETRSGSLAALRFGLTGTACKNTVTDYPKLRALISGAPLADGTMAEALAILHRLAEAEATVHGVPLQRVHFHELADWDSLTDVVAAGSIAAALKVTRWTVGPVPLGSGTVTTVHGVLPVPAPATAHLLTGFACVSDGVPGERVTPTGAAILSHLATPGAPAGRLVSSGFGAGTRVLPGVANVVRVLTFVYEHQKEDCVAVLAFDVDDMTGEELSVAADKLRDAAGVIDVTLGWRQGKKGRPVTEVRLLVQPNEVDLVAARCLSETTTLGLRWRIEPRITVPREATHVATDAGLLQAKSAVRPGGRLTTKVESDDLAPFEGLARRRSLADTP